MDWKSEHVRMLRTALGMNQRSFATALGVAQTQIQRWETRSVPSHQASRKRFYRLRDWLLEMEPLKVRELRRLLGWNHDQMAEAFGVIAATIRFWENPDRPSGLKGKEPVDKETIKLLLEVLNISQDQLADGLGCSRETVRLWVHGRMQPTETSLNRMREFAERRLDGMTGVEVRALRAKLGLTQAEMGEKVGVTGTSVGNWESGRVAPSDDAKEKLAALQESTATAGGNGSAQSAPPVEEPAVEKPVVAEPRRMGIPAGMPPSMNQPLTEPAIGPARTSPPLTAQSVPVPAQSVATPVEVVTVPETVTVSQVVQGRRLGDDPDRWTRHFRRLRCDSCGLKDPEHCYECQWHRQSHIIAVMQWKLDELEEALDLMGDEVKSVQRR